MSGIGERWNAASSIVCKGWVTGSRWNRLPEP
jgi:hypothetical protein